jgi:hypothetical protein
MWQVSIRTLRAYGANVSHLTLTAATAQEKVSPDERATAIATFVAALHGTTGRGMLDFDPRSVSTHTSCCCAPPSPPPHHHHHHVSNEMTAARRLLLAALLSCSEAMLSCPRSLTRGSCELLMWSIRSAFEQVRGVQWLCAGAGVEFAQDFTETPPSSSRCLPRTHLKECGRQETQVIPSDIQRR